jgi:hypothetical protein
MGEQGTWLRRKAAISSPQSGGRVTLHETLPCMKNKAKHLKRLIDSSIPIHWVEHLAKACLNLVYPYRVPELPPIAIPPLESLPVVQ